MDTQVSKPEAYAAVMQSTTDRSNGRAAHQKWERTRGTENECVAERRLRDEATARGETISPNWWNGWFERSDEWRDEIGHNG